MFDYIVYPVLLCTAVHFGTKYQTALTLNILIIKSSNFLASVYFATMLKHALSLSAKDPLGCAVPIFAIRLAVVCSHWLTVPTLFYGLYKQDRRFVWPLLIADVSLAFHYQSGLYENTV